MSEYNQKILGLAKQVAEVTGYALPTIGRKAIADGRVFKRLEAGRECYPSTYERLEKWLKAELKKHTN
jgi:hypothetical protein